MPTAADSAHRRSDPGLVRQVDAFDGQDARVARQAVGARPNRQVADGARGQHRLDDGGTQPAGGAGNDHMPFSQIHQATWR